MGQSESQTKKGSGKPVAAARRQRLSAPERRAQILDSAREVFLRSGASGTRVKDLADAAGVNPALLYQHFPSKEELFEEAVMVPLVEAWSGTIELFPQAEVFELPEDQVREATQTYIRNLLEAMDQTAPLLGVVLFDDLDAGRVFFQERLEPVMERMAEVVREHLPSWAHIDYDPDVAVQMTFGAAWMFALESRFGSRSKRDLDQLAEQMTTIFFEGLLSR